MEVDAKKSIAKERNAKYRPRLVPYSVLRPQGPEQIFTRLDGCAQMKRYYEGIVWLYLQHPHSYLE